MVVTDAFGMISTYTIGLMTMFGFRSNSLLNKCLALQRRIQMKSCCDGQMGRRY